MNGRNIFNIFTCCKTPKYLPVASPSWSAYGKIRDDWMECVAVSSLSTPLQIVMDERQAQLYLPSINTFLTCNFYISIIVQQGPFYNRNQAFKNNILKIFYGFLDCIRVQSVKYLEIWKSIDFKS